MGLFDRFRKKVKQADDDNTFMAEAGSEMAEKAIADREAALSRIAQTDETTQEPTETDSEWDEFEDEIADPFSTPANSKDP